MFCKFNFKHFIYALISTDILMYILVHNVQRGIGSKIQSSHVTLENMEACCEKLAINGYYVYSWQAEAYNAGVYAFPMLRITISCALLCIVILYMILSMYFRYLCRHLVYTIQQILFVAVRRIAGDTANYIFSLVSRYEKIFFPSLSLSAGINKIQRTTSIKNIHFSNIYIITLIFHMKINTRCLYVELFLASLKTANKYIDRTPFRCAILSILSRFTIVIRHGNLF